MERIIYTIGREKGFIVQETDRISSNQVRAERWMDTCRYNFHFITFLISKRRKRK